MDPSLLEIIRSAIAAARTQGLGARDQRIAAQAVVLAMVPSLAPSVASLIVDQLCPVSGERAAA